MDEALKIKLCKFMANELVDCVWDLEDYGYRVHPIRFEKTQLCLLFKEVMDEFKE